MNGTPAGSYGSGSSGVVSLAAAAGSQPLSPSDILSQSHAVHQFPSAEVTPAVDVHGRVWAAILRRCPGPGPCIDLGRSVRCRGHRPEGAAEHRSDPPPNGWGLSTAGSVCAGEGGSTGGGSLRASTAAVNKQTGPSAGAGRQQPNRSPAAAARCITAGAETRCRERYAAY